MTESDRRYVESVRLEGRSEADLTEMAMQTADLRAERIAELEAEARAVWTRTLARRERARVLLNSLGIAGPNIPHEEQVAPDPKWDAEEMAVWERTRDERWCVCGRLWPCDAQELFRLVAGATDDRE